jgi:Fe-S cluster assembly protein SufD
LTQATEVAIDRGAVEALASQRGEPDWLRAARLAAWERFETLPRPTLQTEGWRRTDIRALDLERLASPASAPANPAPDLAESLGAATERAGLLVLHNGAVARAELSEALASRGVLLMSLAEAVQTRPELVQPYLSSGRVRPNSSKFDALAAALWTDGVLVYLPRNTIAEAPLQIVHWVDAPGAALSHTLIVAEEGSQAALVESFVSPPDQPESLACGGVEIVAKQAARISYVYLQERDEQAWSFANLWSQQARDSAVRWLLLGLGGQLSRTELTCDLDGQGSEADLVGLVLGQHQQRFDLQSLQNHVGNDTRSDLVLKVALRDSATSNFTGMIRVGKTALRTASNQENRNLLLSDHARADSDPKLEILNSDVTRCGHGATVGPVDEELIFYLMTRGLTRAQAERLIVEGFFEPLLAGVPLQSLRDRLWAAVSRKLGV